MARRWWGACVTVLFLTLPPSTRADYLVVSRSATLKGTPASDGPTLDHLSRGDVLALLEEAQTEGGVTRRTLGLQITELCVESRGKSSAEVLYEKKD